MIMAGYLGTDDQWSHFGLEWNFALRTDGISSVHAVDLFKRTKQFRGWTAEAVNAFARSLDHIISKHIELAFSVIIRTDDYETIYKANGGTKNRPQDSKYGVCFRACLAFLPSYIASEIKAGGATDPSTRYVINFILESGHRNSGDAARLFALFKADALPEWKEFVGTFHLVTKADPAAQAADFLACCVYRAELLEHGEAPTATEQSSYVFAGLSAPDTVNSGHIEKARKRGGPIVFRIPITRRILQDLTGQSRSTRR